MLSNSADLAVVQAGIPHALASDMTYDELPVTYYELSEYSRQQYLVRHGVTKVSRKECIIRALQTGGEESASNLARICDCPEASIRRTIQELRRDGHNIAFADVHEQIYRIGA